MTDVTTGRHLVWQAADTTGISSKTTLQVVMLAWLATSTSARDIADTDELKITDEAGIVVIQKMAGAKGDGIDPVNFSPPLALSGIKIATLGGGELFITLRDDI